METDEQKYIFQMGKKAFWFYAHLWRWSWWWVVGYTWVISCNSRNKWAMGYTDSSLLKKYVMKGKTLIKITKEFIFLHIFAHVRRNVEASSCCIVAVLKMNSRRSYWLNVSHINHWTSVTACRDDLIRFNLCFLKNCGNSLVGRSVLL